MRHYHLTAATVIGLSLGACTPTGAVPLPTQSPRPIPATPATPSSAPNRETQPQPVEARFPDCGDSKPPCVTYDDGAQGNGIYLVTSTKPFHAMLLPACNVEDYPTNLPCALKHPDARTGEWITLRRGE